ncbi:unnamed protein product [Diabrotica balteata]|uniref:HTH psq-type domain-containing protein n=1 Tax=Diabrotica balteata TaxID=107213 RepID=A0A9N9XA92_DIABA|nr:unnamed protein product [Diabrotica balteata]
MRRKMLAYPEEAVAAAIEDVRLGMSIASAAKRHQVPRVTLLYKVKGKTPISRRTAPKTILTSDEENLLVQWILDSSEAKFPITQI